MNDPASPRWTDPATLPPPTIYDPGDDAAPPFAGGDLPTVVLLLVGEVDPAWAAATAVSICDAWAEVGRKVVLSDFHLETPVLQDRLGGEGLEGVVDLFVYGASMVHLTRRPDGHAFEFIPTGTYTPDAEALFRHPRWSKLIAGFRHSHATLVLFVPAEAADLGTLATWVDRCMLLGEPGDPAHTAPLIRAGTEIRALIVPPRGDAVANRRPSDLPPVEPVAGMEEAAVPGDRREEMHLPPPPPRVQNRSHRAGVLFLWILLGVAILTAIGYIVASVRPDLMPWTRRPPVDSSSLAPASAGRAVGTPRPLGERLPYSVRVVAFGNFQAAHDRVLDLRQRVPGVLFYVNPEDVQGITYFKVMAGAVPTAEVAREIRDVLLASEVLDSEEVASDWSLVQEEPLALLVGNRDSRGAANAAVDSLLAVQVPAYAVAVPYSDGFLRWYLYAGAFKDSSSAAPLRERLSAAGLDPRLSPRFGSPATPEL